MVAVNEDTGLVKVHGRGTFKISGSLKNFGLAALESGCRDLVLDMSDCVGMDSTFMGVLAGLSAEQRNRDLGRMILFNLSEKNRGLLATLGLDHVVQASLAGAPPSDLPEAARHMDQMEALPVEAEKTSETAKTMLEAHENLVDVTPDNYPRFKDVLQFLREDVEKASGRQAVEPGKESA
jgi:anti-anti-sigma regulatory factor